MLIYENDNKLNINFENEIGTPDIQISKDNLKIGDSEITPDNTLPVLTAQDVGKTLVIDDEGKYALKDMSRFIITATDNGDGTISVDKTIDEIEEAIEMNRLIYLHFFSTFFNLMTYNIDNNNITDMLFLYLDLDTDSSVLAFTQVLYNSGQWSYKEL